MKGINTELVCPSQQKQPLFFVPREAQLESICQFKVARESQNKPLD